ncbi:hydrolase TatD [Pseudomonas agarici]|uniref:Hydrolase TatD n=1 Tax=Pseudomonas agarici TaxID=46677 RepID=A0A0X1T3Z0_PSEAA|nr:TatD family hydrolase [Pseudomonas agarici]AMB86778.1 hydrolase TatD [Pseudomonas agarici]NWB90791.1 TatD family hydrolase [Pseudomonas agarici]NWC08571.1 TatD family hydrolase [Pseudomonas agarici]SEL24939.1 TatD DNase family protein [Pseudomonas agarici]
MELIDTHTHLDFADFDEDRDALLDRSRALGVGRMVVLGVYRRNWQRVWDLVLRDPQLHAAFGLHPVYLEDHRPADLDQLGDWLSLLANHPQLCAVGEFGLDYFLPQLDRERQQVLFEAQLKLAVDFNLPALLHVRRSHAATIATLKRFRPARGGIIHAFAGSREEAREYLKLGFKLGLGGAGTWPQALRLGKVIADLPLDAVVLETDSPDMAPVMYPGMRNSPEHLPAICAALAKLMAISPLALATASTANACTLFNWPLSPT